MGEFTAGGCHLSCLLDALPRHQPLPKPTFPVVRMHPSLLCVRNPQTRCCPEFVCKKTNPEMSPVYGLNLVLFFYILITNCFSRSSPEQGGTQEKLFKLWQWAELAEGCWWRWEWLVWEVCTWHRGTDLRCDRPLEDR